VKVVLKQFHFAAEVEETEVAIKLVEEEVPE
jgi:hypothetical protein